MDRYEVCVTFYLDAETAEDASTIVEGLLIINQDYEDNEIDFIIFGAVEV